MVVDQNFRNLKKFLFFLILLILFPLTCFAQNFDFKKIMNLEAPWGSSFINAKEIIVTENAAVSVKKALLKASTIWMILCNGAYRKRITLQLSELTKAPLT